MALNCTYVVVFFAWALGGTVGGATGIGTVMIAMPIMTAVISPGDAVLVSCITGTFASLHLAYSYRRYCSCSDLRDLTIGLIPGCIAGAWVLKIVSVRVLELMICAMLALFVLLRCFRRISAYTLPESRLVGTAAGAICGFVSSSVAMEGAPLGIYVLLKHWDPNRARSNMSVFYAISAVGTVIMQALAGLYDFTLFRMSLFGMAGCVCGQVIGVRLGRHINQKLFTRIIVCFLALTTVFLFFQAIG